MDQTSNNPPVVGAALPIESVEHLRDWLFGKDRDLELQDFVQPNVLDGDWQAIVGRYESLLDGYRGRIGIHGPFFGFDMSTVDPQVQAIAQQRFLQGLGICEALGATHMVVHSPFTHWHHDNFDNGAWLKDHLFEACHTNLAPVVRRAEDIGCELVIENIQDVDPRERVRLAESFDSPMVRVSVDTGHAQWAHKATGAPPVDYFVKAAGNNLAHVHLQDADGCADRHWLPGVGTILWPAFFEALRDYADNPRLVIEVFGKYHADIPACVARLEAEGLAQ